MVATPQPDSSSVKFGAPVDPRDLISILMQTWRELPKHSGSALTIHLVSGATVVAVPTNDSITAGVNCVTVTGNARTTPGFIAQFIPMSVIPKDMIEYFSVRQAI